MKRGRIRKRKVSYDFKHFRKKFIYKLLIIVCIILFFIALTWLIFFVLEKIARPVEEAGLGGELGTLIRGFGFDEETGVYFPSDCNIENFTVTWQGIFNEDSLGIINVSNDDCTKYLVYKVSEGNVVYILAGGVVDNEDYLTYSLSGIYANLTTPSINYLNLIDGGSIDEMTTSLFFFGLQMGEGVQGYRNISNISLANDEFSNMFFVKNGTWENNGYGIFTDEEYFSFDDVGSGAIYKNITFDYFSQSIDIIKPINLTQINIIGDIEINGSRTSAYTLDLGDYFENLGYEDYNLSIRFNVPFGAQPVGFSYSYYSHYVNFNTQNTVGGTFVMNITLSHPDWNNRENVTSNNFNVTIYGCLDSDGSSGRYAKTTTQNLSENKTDFCVDSSNVMEYYCSYQNIRNYSLSCGSGYYCSDGACVINTSVNHAPVFNSSYCDDLEWEMNTSYILDMKTCWIDDDNDTLTFRYENSSERNLTISRTGNNLTLTPATNWNGTGYFYIYANDSEDETRGTVDFRVFKIINVTANITTNQTNVSVNNTPVIKSPLPSSDEINISYNESLDFSIEAENYESIKWYLDGVLVKSDVSSYTAEKLSEGEHEIKVEVRKGTNVISKSWSLSVSGEETPKKINAIWYFVALMIILGLIILVVIFFIVKNVIEKREENIPKPIIKELRPGTRIGYIPPSKPSYS